MNTLGALVRRNLLSYTRDRTAVFFSMLSSILLLMLYFLFLGQLQIESLRESMPPQTTDAEIGYFVSSWVYAGIVMITTFSTGLGALGIYIDDRVSGRLDDFRVSPIHESKLILGYQLSAVIIATVMSTLVLIVGAALVAIMYGSIPAFGSLLAAFGLIVLMSVAFAAISSFVLTFINSTGGYTAFSTIVGTLLGFLAGAYLPVGLLSTGITNTINALPFSWGAMLLREPLAGGALDEMTHGISEARTAIGDYYGFTLHIGDSAVEPVWAIAGLAIIAIVFTALGSWRIGRTIK
ncbi:ABC transporter permease [Leucobacter sp. cx-328]|uniref:ABC transporter permease n=1 Tax=unclassified Leucobacter TaxID=2621730 RepID=UPI00165D8D5E|nr:MULTISPECIES: ABC transporter permease [unclassified Leucobacter]MBC9943714.1 ABC transporter permease [Leucobacter sp. cx-328]